MYCCKNNNKGDDNTHSTSSNRDVTQSLVGKSDDVDEDDTDRLSTTLSHACAQACDSYHGSHRHVNNNKFSQVPTTTEKCAESVQPVSTDDGRIIHSLVTSP